VALVAGGSSHGLPAPLGPLAVVTSAHRDAVLPAHPIPGLHGDLVVDAANSPFVISPATAGGFTFVQQGNITVQAGGQLIIEDVTLDFVQFVSNTGTLSQRVSHIYTFTDQGTTDLVNASIVTDTSVLNAYAKLTLNISAGGVFDATNSSLMFPGWIQVYGPGSTLSLNLSTIRGNPAIQTLIENESLEADTVYAASLSASDGAQVSLWASSIVGVYTDNVTFKGMPGPIALANYGEYQLSASSSQDITTFDQPTDSENVTRADLYPSFAGGTVILGYNANFTTSATGSTFTFGTTFPLPTINFPQGIGFVSVPIPPAAVAAINAVGPLGWLQATGAFQNASSIALHIGTTGNAAPLTVAYTAIQLTPDLDYNITASGAGTTFTAVDSTLDLNWNQTPGTPVPAGTAAPTPWGSNKLLLTDGATAYLASVTIVEGRVGVFFNQSVVIPDATSNAYFYRWAEVPVYAAGGVPVIDAQLSAFYSYSSSEANNATATSLNDLATADPSLAAYVTSWDQEHGVAAYGETAVDGIGSLLLATTALNQATLPDGTYLGGYHLAVALPNGGSAGVKWGYVSVTPYPAGMTPASPDVQGEIVYGNYASNIAIGSISWTINGLSAPNESVTIGSTLSVTATLTNTGNAPIQNYSANFSYWLPAPFQPKVVAPTQAFTTMLAGGTQTVTFNWTVNESIVGAHGTFNATFVLASEWNGGTGPNAGSVSVNINVTIAPSLISLTFIPPSTPSGDLVVNEEYIGNGNVTFNGSGDATINVTAIAADGQQFFLSTSSVPSGPFQGTVIIGPTEPTGKYTLVVTGFYNGRTATDTIKNAFSIAAPPSAPPTFLNQKFLGLPILYWIIIAIAAIIAVVAVLMLLRRTARGKVVECGECGALIPEDATACPQCGAEFESDLVRCSRCGSTIPADSQVCPECAAQLLGKPEDEARDPERQGYSDVVERFRGESKKELGENYSEGAFWDWWKRQPTYLSFSQYRLQQAQGNRSGMGAPPTGAEAAAATPVPPPAGKKGAPAAAVRIPAKPAAAPASTAPPAAPAQPSTPAPAATPAQPPSSTPPSAGMKPCSNCGKEIPPEYLVCPFCGAVTQ
jgi:RNA polymerase subunit RPABC4/transcription elongation factor Spt4